MASTASGNVAPTPGRLISAGIFSALLCLPVYALLMSLAMYVAGLFGPGMFRASLLEFLGAMVVMIPFSLLGILIWPLSLILAAVLFALVGRLLAQEIEPRRGRNWIWAAAGAAVGLLTGIAMAMEAHWRSSYPFGAEPDFGTVPIAIPTGILGMLFCRRIIRRSVLGPGRYVSHRYL